jgi:hypothetical protein
VLKINYFFIILKKIISAFFSIMKILGISAFYHDSAASMIKDGEIIAAVQEERFSRKKHDAGFPFNSIRYLPAEVFLFYL